VGLQPGSFIAWQLSVGVASAPSSVLILAWGCDGDPSVVSGDAGSSWPGVVPWLSGRWG